MKKIVTAVAAMAMAASMFAVDVAATLNIVGNVASKGGNVIGLDNTNFKDGKDLLSLAANGDVAGASVGLGTADGTDGGHIDVRSASIWIKPVDMLKITFGSLGDEKTYCEHICWWRTPESSGSFNAFPGVSFDLTPMEGLRVVASLKTGWGDYFFKNGLGEYSIFAKYNFGVGDAAVGFHDAGNKTIQIGGSYGNEWGGNFFGFVNAYLFADNNFKFNEFAIDNWFKFKAGDITASARVPFVMGIGVSKKWMDWELKAELPVSGFNVYGNVGSANAVWNQNPTVNWGQGGYYDLDNFNFSLGFRAGAGFNVGNCGLDMGVALKYAGGIDWKLPFSAKVSY